MSDVLYNLGTQPLDAIMEQAGLSNRALVEASGESLTFKVVAKARRGRRLTLRTQEKVVRAVNRAAEPAAFTRDELFTYRGT